MPVEFLSMIKHALKLILIEGIAMFVELCQRITHPEIRQIFVVDIDSDEDIFALHSAVLEAFPTSLFFSDEEKWLAHGSLPLNKTREYLGLTTSAVILDIRAGFPLDYFLSIAATIAAGGILVLLAKETLDITESQRFHEAKVPTPYFHDYLTSMLKQFAYRWQEGCLCPPQYEHSLILQDQDEIALLAQADEQLAIMTDFLQEDQGVFTLFSARGSGKSWLGAKIIAGNPGHYILTAPNQNAIEQYQWIEGLQFRAPDALFLTIKEDDQQPQTLIIEEAAKMPLVHLERLCRRFKKVLMISSVENYEGTGQGLSAKIQDLVMIKSAYQLYELKRFMATDPLKALCDALMFRESSVLSIPSSAKAFSKRAILQKKLPLTCSLPEISLQLYDDRNIADLRGDLPQLRELYHLFNHTHYQTNIQDLRRLFDVPSQVFVLAYYQELLIGAIWAMEEGGLSPALTAAVFNGLRRPKGNLVAQMLTGQSYFPEAMLAKSVRISRISVIEPLRRLGIGQAMVQFLEKEMVDQRAFISVSFGLTQPLLQFWESMDYQMAHLGFHLDKTTGLHSGVVLKDLSKSQAWIRESLIKFKADAALNVTYRTYRPEILQILQDKALEGSFDQRDQRVIEAFYRFKRAKHTVENAFLREKTL